MEQEQSNNQDIKSGSDLELKGKKSIKKPIIISLIIILLVGVISFGLIWYFKDKLAVEKNKNDSASKEIKHLKIATLDGPMNIFFPGDGEIFASAYYYIVNNQLAEGLVSYEDMTKIVPNLATSWKNPDENTWVFNLKKDVKFHTGRTMTADDVVYSINKAKEDEGFDLYSSTISSIKALSKYEVEIKTDKPDAVLLNKLSMLHIIDSKGDTNTASGGTGAYMIKPGTKPSKGKIDLVAFDDYHAGRPMTRQLSFFVVDSEQAAYDAVKSKKANIGGEFAEDMVSKIDKSSDKVRKIGGAFITYLSINTIRPDSPLQKKEVRQAVRLALSLDKLIKDSGIDATSVSQSVTQEIPGYNPNIKVPKQDIEKAKQLLTEAGYPNGFTINFTHTKSGNEAVSKSIINQLAQIGVKIEEVVVSSDDFGEFYDLITGGKTDLAILGYSSDTYDAFDVYDGVFREDGIYSSAQLDKYMEEANTEFDAKKRLKILQDIATFANEETPIIPLFSRNYYWVTDNASYVLPRDISNQALGVYYWKAHLK